MKKIKPIKAKSNYFFEEDILSAMPLKRDYDSSFQIGDFILDLDENGEINGVEILNASEKFNIPKIFLKNMISWKLKLEVNDSYIILEFYIKTNVRNADRIITANIERVKPEFLKPTQLNLAVA